MNTKLQVFIVFLLLGNGPMALCYDREVHESVIEEVHEWDESEDLGGFFGVDDTEPRTIERPQKEKMSRAKIIMIRLGIKAAMACESFYSWLRSVCAYLKSLVWSA